MSNFTILNDKIITSKYVLDLINHIEKAESKDEAEKVLYNEFSKLILQGKVTFLFLYCDRYENRIRGRVRASAGFRHGTQRKDFIPDNKWPKTRSKNKTALRYYDFGRAGWRSFRKNHFIVATSFWDDRENKWKDNPYDAGFTSDWDKIKGLNRLEDYKPVNRPDTKEEREKRDKVIKREAEKRVRQIKKTQNKIKKSLVIENGIIKIK